MRVTADPLQTRMTDIVHFRDSDGVVWRVFELPRTATVDRQAAHSLVFECDAKIRRVRGYPPDWHALSPSALEKLSWQR